MRAGDLCPCLQGDEHVPFGSRVFFKRCQIFCSVGRGARFQFDFGCGETSLELITDEPSRFCVSKRWRELWPKVRFVD